jgi:succinyl-CoA synthetase alpha subunit
LKKQSRTSGFAGCSVPEASKAFPKADVFINFASFRSAYESSMEALQQPTIRVIAVIAEGVPEADTKKLIAYARAHNKILLGPATVGGLQVRTYCFIGLGHMSVLHRRFLLAVFPFLLRIGISF